MENNETIPLNDRDKKDMDKNCCTLKETCSWLTEILIRLLLIPLVWLVNSDMMPTFHRQVQPQNWPQANYPHLKHGTIPYSHVVIVACAAPMVVFIIYSICYCLGNKQNKFQHLMNQFIQGFLAITLALIMTELITDIMKKWIGRHRPDYLSRCYTPNEQQFDDVAWPVLPSKVYDVNGTGYLERPFIEDVPAIFNESETCFDSDEAKSGRKSFPSGHTSFAFAGATFTALLAFYYSNTLSGGVRIQSRPTQFKVPGASLSLTLLMICYIPALYVAISRTQVQMKSKTWFNSFLQDYRHYASDVIAGGLLGTFITYACFVNYYSIQLFSRRKHDSSSLP